MRFIHLLVGSIILFFDWLFTPRAIKRNPQLQEEIDVSTSKLTLYQYKACPFCVKVRRQIKRQSLKIETLDIKRNTGAKEELESGGGKLKVPCLKMVNEAGEVNWMYESSDIIDYLKRSYRPG